MEGLNPVQISELATLLEDAVLQHASRLNAAIGVGRSALAVEEHIQGMRSGIQRWRAKQSKQGADPNYIQSLSSSIQIANGILDRYARVRRSSG